jgi:hypothetical protein
LGIVLNEPLASFEEKTMNSDHLVLVYIFDSYQYKSLEMNKKIIIPLMDDLKGMIKVYAFDCENSAVSANPDKFYMCGTDADVPYIYLLKPAEIRTDPST